MSSNWKRGWQCERDQGWDEVVESSSSWTGDRSGRADEDEIGDGDQSADREDLPVGDNSSVSNDGGEYAS